MLLCVEGKLVWVAAQVQEGKLHFSLERLGMDKANFGYTPFIIVGEDVFESLMTIIADDSIEIRAGESLDSKAQAVDGTVNN